MGFHVPRISINIDRQGDSSFGEVKLLALGFGLHEAWIYSTMMGSHSIFGTAPAQEALAGNLFSLAYFVSIAVYACVLLAAAALDTKLIKFFHSLPVLATTALCSTVGSFLLLMSAGGAWPTEACLVSSGILTGFGSSVYLITWGIMFSRNEVTTIVLNGSFAIIIGFSVYGLGLHQLPFPIGGVAASLIPLVEFALILVIRSGVNLDFENRQLMFQPLPINHGRFVVRFGIPVFLIGSALSLLRETSISNLLVGTSLDDQSFLFVTATIAALFILAAFLFLNDEARWSNFFRMLIPIIAISSLAIPFAQNDSSFWATAIVMVAYMSLESLMWIFFGELSQRFRLSPIFIFGLGRGVMAVAALGASYFPYASGTFASFETFGNTTIILAIIIPLLIAYAILPTEREIASLVVKRTAKATIGAEGDAETDSELLAAHDVQRGTEEQVGTEVPAGNAMASNKGGFAPRQGKGQGEAGQISAESETAESMTQGLCDEIDEDLASATNEIQTEASNTTLLGNAAPSALDLLQASVAGPANQTQQKQTGRTHAQQGYEVMPPNQRDQQAEPLIGATAGSLIGSSTEPLIGSSTEPLIGSTSETLIGTSDTHTRNRTDFSRSIFGDAPQGSGTPDPLAPAAPERRKGRFRERCDIIANTYLLSRRECEVLYYLVRGYKSAYIQQQLYISEGTAKTHIRHIYRKLNVHSQQELIHLVDEVEL